MPFPVDVDATWLNPAAVQLDAGELRRADAALLAGAGGFAFGGVARHSDTSLAVTVDGSDNVTIQPGSAVIPGDAATGVGVYRAGLTAAVTHPLPTARNATNGRIDLVVFRAMDTDVVGSHAAYKGRIDVITGTPSATPAAPAKPSMAVELGRITVPASGGGAASVDSTYRTYACAAGGVLVVPTSSRLPGSGVTVFQKARTLDTGVAYTWDGTAWGPDMLLQTASGDFSNGAVTVLGSLTLPKGRWLLRGKAVLSWDVTGVSGTVEQSLFITDVANAPFDTSRATATPAVGKDTLACETYVDSAGGTVVRLVAQSTTNLDAGKQVATNGVISAIRV